MRTFSRPIANDEFATNFQTRATLQLDSIDKQLENFYYMLEDIALDFKYNKNVLQSFEFLTLFRMKFDEHIEHHSSHYTAEQMEYVTKVCRKINETYYFNLIREKYFELLSVNPDDLVRYEDFLGVNQECEAESGKKTQDQAGVEDEVKYHPPVQLLQQPIKKVAAQNDEVIESVGKQGKTDENIIVVNLEEEKQEKADINENEKLKEDKLKEFNELIEAFDEGYTSHKIDIAHRCYQNILELLKSKSEMEESQRTQIEAKMEKYDHVFKEMERLYKEMLSVHHELSHEEGWVVEKVRKGMIIKYKAEKGESVGLKFEMEIDIPIMNLLALIYEVDLYPNWFPFLKKGVQLKLVHRAAKIAYTEMSFPPPVSNREGYFLGCGYDRLQENGSIFLTVKTIHDQPEIAQEQGVDIPDHTKMVRLDVKYFAFEILPLSREKAFIKAVANVDPKLKFIPMGMINWMMRKFSGMLMDKMLNKARNFKGSPWEKRVKENPAFYDWANGVADNFFSKMESSNAMNLA